MNFLARAKELQGEMVAWRRHIHANPEIGEDLPETALFVKSKLLEFGLEPVEIFPCCLVVTISGPKEGKCILLRADMDALPMEEETDLPFKSTNGYMHSCGHDIHTAMMLAASKILHEYRNELAGTVKIVFQPGEETFQGSKHMMEAGVLENPHVDAALTMHVDGLSAYPVGSVTLVEPGIVLASCDNYRINIKGKGCHGATPNQGVDPINVGAHIHIALQELMSREINGADVACLTQGTFHAGVVPNVIPDTAYMEGTLRTFDEDLRSRLLDRIREICEYTAKAFRAEAVFEVLGGCATFLDDPVLFGEVEGYLKELLGDYYVHEGPEGVYMASEDFSNVTHVVPSLQLDMVLGCFRDGAKYPMHHPKIVFDESPMYRGAASMAYAAYKYLQTH